MTTNSREYMRAYYRSKRKEVLDKLGGKCVLCGDNDHNALEIHHKNGYGGKNHPNGSRGGIDNLWNAIKHIREGRQDELELLCWRCH